MSAILLHNLSKDSFIVKTSNMKQKLETSPSTLDLPGGRRVVLQADQPGQDHRDHIHHGETVWGDVTTTCTFSKFFGWNITPILILDTLPTNWQSSLLNRRREQSGSHFVHFKLVWLQAMSNFFIKFWPMREDLQSWYLTQMVLFFYWAMMTANWLVVYRVQVFDWYFIQQTYWLYRGQCFPCWAKMTANLLSSVSSVKCKYGINFHANFDWWDVQSLCHFIYLWCCKLLV